MSVHEHDDALFTFDGDSPEGEAYKRAKKTYLSWVKQLEVNEVILERLKEDARPLVEKAEKAEKVIKDVFFGLYVKAMEQEGFKRKYGP